MRLLIVTLSAGQGHLSVASALAEAAQDRGIGTHVLDAAEVNPRGLYGSAPASFRVLSTRFVPAYNLVWRVSERDRIHRAVANYYARQVTTRLGGVLKASKATHILTVAPLFLGASVSRTVTVAGIQATTALLATDLCTPHRSWLAGPETSVFAPTTAAAHRLQRFTGSPVRALSGLPIARGFFHRRQDPRTARRSQGLAPDKFTILLWGGGLGTGAIGRTMSCIPSACARDCQIVLLAGRNKGLVRQFRAQVGVHVLPFVSDVVPLMDAADVIVGKPGSSAVTESAARRRWCIYTGPVGLQEEGNAAYGVERGWGVNPGSPRGITEELRAAYVRWLSGKELFAAGAAPVPEAADEMISRLCA